MKKASGIILVSIQFKRIFVSFAPDINAIGRRETNTIVSAGLNDYDIKMPAFKFLKLRKDILYLVAIVPTIDNVGSRKSSTKPPCHTLQRTTRAHANRGAVTDKQYTHCGINRMLFVGIRASREFRTN